MRDTPTRRPAPPGPNDPASPGSDLFAMVVRGTLAVILGCGAAAIFLLALVLLLGLFLG